MEPFGPENRSPVFYTEGVVDSGYAKLVGQDKSHLKARFVQGSSFINFTLFFNERSFSTLRREPTPVTTLLFEYLVIEVLSKYNTL